MSSQQIVPFLFEGEGLLRVMDRDGAPWFVAADICRAIDIKNVAQAVEPLDDDEKGISSTYTLKGQQEVIIVSEGGLYTLILRSRDAIKPGTVAHRFRRWVTSEVLPALRRGEGMKGPDSTGPLGELGDDEPQSPDGMKLRKVNTAARCFGERAGAQLWVKLGLEWVPAMAAALSQADLLDSPQPPGAVTITVMPAKNGGGHH
ncbi:BRO-N domain-containing protein [Rhodovarius lipocyclicus]|uniref:BRO-N domain-containing protein n=1 Tax=Rhodovarius lipocyclicus TaxID=268410 RepID=UPI001358DA55|nr:BRO family protein [Rhodovarius lipocyclicus]